MSGYRGGTGTPLVLIHGFSANWRCWRPVIPALEEHHEVYAVNLAGHFEGAPWEDGLTVSVDAVVDAAERELDSLALERAHLVGNSLGGWVALALGARRRGLSVVALSPAGGWEAGTRAERHLQGYFMRSYRLMKLLGPRVEPLVRRPRFRALVFRDVSERAAAIPAALAVDLIRAASNCDVYVPLVTAVGEGRGFPAELAEIDCPVRIAWSERDRILPQKRYSAELRRLVPSAEWTVLPGLGHVPWLDDPAATVEAILEVTSRVDAGERTEAAGAAAS
jgi:pimeloyl-ACP methyl ester carboxylesterase